MESASVGLEVIALKANEGQSENTEDDDQHFCIKCKTTISGIEAYISHRRKQCNKLLEKVCNPFETFSKLYIFLLYFVKNWPCLNT